MRGKSSLRLKFQEQQLQSFTVNVNFLNNLSMFYYKHHILPMKPEKGQQNLMSLSLIK
jgi:hypothetical protein